MNEQELTDRIMLQLPKLLPEVFHARGDIRKGHLKNTWQNTVDAVYSADVEAEVETPTGIYRFIIEVKSTDRIAPLREAAIQVRREAQRSGAVPIVAGNFLGDRARQTLKQEGVGYVDLAGNFFLQRDGLYAEKIVDKNPFSSKPPLKNIFAPTSSRITRAMLIEPMRAWSVSELSKTADVSLGQTHKVLEAMGQEELAVKGSSGKWIVANPTALLEAWKKVYPTYQNKLYRMFSFASDTQLPGLIMRASQEADLPYALSSFSGADLVAPYIRGLSKVQLYTTREAIEVWKQKLDLKEVDSGGNVELWVPYDSGVFYGLQEYQRGDGTVKIVSDVQLYMDLFHDPARGEEAATHLREIKLGY